MAGCNCKTEKKNDSYITDDSIPSNEGVKVSAVSYVFKILGFLLFLAVSPIVMLVIIWFVFRTLVLDKNVDLKPILLSIITKLSPNDKDDSDDFENIEDLSEDDVILMGVDDITNTSN